MPVITLTSDFGEGSPYVAAMKAALLAACPEAALVDVSHSVRPFDILGGAFVLWAGTRHFAPGAVHLAVVDPGVGGSRRPVAFELAGSWYVGPDNGLFGLVLAEATALPRAVELRRPAGASATFEGRDVFAPAAGALASGVPLAGLGSHLADGLMPLPSRSPCVLWVDNFGNVVTSLKAPATKLRVNGREVGLTVRTYSDAPPDTPFVYVGSMGLLEVGVRQSRADEWLGAGPGDAVEAAAEAASAP